MWLLSLFNDPLGQVGAWSQQHRDEQPLCPVFSLCLSRWVRATRSAGQRNAPSDLRKLR